jgi:hypothetical protein
VVLAADSRYLTTFRVLVCRVSVATDARRMGAAILGMMAAPDIETVAGTARCARLR